MNRLPGLPDPHDPGDSLPVEPDAGARSPQVPFSPDDEEEPAESGHSSHDHDTRTTP
jgi:hypothetical protein